MFHLLMLAGDSYVVEWKWWWGCWCVCNLSSGRRQHLPAHDLSRSGPGLCRLPRACLLVIKSYLSTTTNAQTAHPPARKEQINTPSQRPREIPPSASASTTMDAKSIPRLNPWHQTHLPRLPQPPKRPLPSPIPPDTPTKTGGRWFHAVSPLPCKKTGSIGPQCTLR